MNIYRYQEVKAFLQAVKGFLLRHEAENNLLFGILDAVQRGSYRRDNYFALVTEADQPLLAALRTPPFNLVLSYPADPAAFSLLADDLLAAGHDLPGVTGAKAAAAAFAACWRQRVGRPYALEMAQRIYKLERVTPPPAVAGQPRRATAADYALLLRWMRAFLRDIAPGHGAAADPARAADIVQRRLDAPPAVGGLYLWEVAGQAVSLAGYTGPTPNGIRVGPVYTPPEHRQRGYASALVAALSQRLLNSGYRFCFLFTDLANPTSNHIYQTLGYQPVCDVDAYHFGV